MQRINVYPTSGAVVSFYMCYARVDMLCTGVEGHTRTHHLLDELRVIEVLLVRENYYIPGSY